VALPTTPKGWAIRLTKIVDLFHQVHGLDRFPIDVSSIAMEFSRQVFPEEPITLVHGTSLPKGFDGMLAPNPSGNREWGIFYNDSIRSRGRRNFTLAHELGHYLLHRTAYPDGLRCTSRNMGDWSTEVGQIEGEANTFASFLLMPLNDFREQISGQVIDLDLMEHLSDRYAVSLTAAILKWLTITEKRAMIVVGKEGFIDWAWSSGPLIKSGVFYRARQEVVELPKNSLAALDADPGDARRGTTHMAGIWSQHEAVQEMTIFAPIREITISLLLYPDASPSRWQMSELEEETTPDAYDRFMSGSCGV